VGTNQLVKFIEQINKRIEQGENIYNEFINLKKPPASSPHAAIALGGSNFERNIQSYESWKVSSIALITKIIPSNHPLYSNTLQVFNGDKIHFDELSCTNDCIARLKAIKDLLEDKNFDISSEIEDRLVEIARILSLIPAGLRRWTWENKPRTTRGEARQWYIDNEYHVQNLLYFLLFPIFPDIKEEEHTPSVGQQNPRSDLAIPSLELIIEVKFMRANITPQKIIEEIAADASLYLVEGSLYKQILPFIWDDSRRNEEHELMRQGLKKINGIFDTVIISRPNKMNNQ
jgi:hypothetical protein